MALLSKRAQQVLVKAGLADLSEEDAADRILCVRGCGRRTLKEIAATLEQKGVKLGGLDRVLKGYSSTPTLTTQAAAQVVGIEIEDFLDLTRKVGVVPKRAVSRKREGGP